MELDHRVLLSMQNLLKEYSTKALGGQAIPKHPLPKSHRKIRARAPTLSTSKGKMLGLTAMKDRKRQHDDDPAATAGVRINQFKTCNCFYEITV